MGWHNLPDGNLLDEMGEQFDALVTMDRSLPFENQLASRSFAVIIL